MKYIQIALSIEMMLDLSTLTIEDVTGHLRAVDEHMEQATATMDSGKLLLTEEEWAARIKEKKSREASSSHGGDGKHRGEASLEKKKKMVDPNACRRCEKTGHWANVCPNHKQEKKAKEKGEVMAVEGHGKALKVVNLDEPHAQVHLGRVGDEQEQWWHLDSSANNHMTGSKEAFSELDGNMTDIVKFGDGSRVVIRGHGTINFSIGQLDERGSEVLIKDDVLRIRDWEQRLLSKVKRSWNRLYLLDLKVEQPIYLAAWHTEEPWLWHALYGHLSFYAHSQLEKMDEVVEAIKKFKAYAEAESDKKLRVLRTDRGDEFTSVEFAAYYVD
ncbi:uncharacterized protein [Miscanthus floridulus]|uniref:uncharacterized protein n=1 Tax=Miscanthus floridulus TaxID=154761 RepID=UPI00345894EC